MGSRIPRAIDFAHEPVAMVLTDRKPDAARMLPGSFLERGPWKELQ